MSNFDFIKADFPQLHADVVEAERLTFDSPTSTVIFCRSTLENAINWLYENDRKLTRPWRADLSTLMHEHCFAEQFNATMMKELHLVRKTGNQAAHGTRVAEGDALASLKYLFRFLRHLAIYYGKSTPETQVFDEALIPRPSARTEPATNAAQEAKQLKKLQDKIDHKNREARAAEKERIEQAKTNAQIKAQLEKAQAELAALKQAREQSVDVATSVPMEVSEAETRRRYIDLSLRECGWTNLRAGYELEYAIKGMPQSTNPSGVGYADYVLWGDDGLPLAVIEAKKTMADARKGKRQAELYADCLQAMHGQRPVIFYTNGFETFLWDDQFSAEREVQGFYSKDELQRVINRRHTRSDLREFTVNKEIAGRPYQLEAIKRVAENTVTQNANGELRGRARQSLLVMATGSGKTRTAAAIVDMFSKCNWAKRVLFLADRNALVTQAKKSFNEHLPNLSAIDLQQCGVAVRAVTRLAEPRSKAHRPACALLSQTAHKVDGGVTIDADPCGIGDGRKRVEVGVGFDAVDVSAFRVDRPYLAVEAPLQQLLNDIRRPTTAEYGDGFRA